MSCDTFSDCIGQVVLVPSLIVILVDFPIRTLQRGAEIEFALPVFCKHGGNQFIVGSGKDSKRSWIILTKVVGATKNNDCICTEVCLSLGREEGSPCGSGTGYANPAARIGFIRNHLKGSFLCKEFPPGLFHLGYVISAARVEGLVFTGDIPCEGTD